MPDSHETSRRAFLRGELRPSDALSDLGIEAISVESEELACEQESGYLLRMSRRAMACNFELLLNAGQHPHSADAAFAALDLIGELESQLTVYRETSEVSEINRTAHVRPIVVEPRLFELFKLARQIHEASGGAYDIAAGALSKLWGFYQRAGRLPAEDEIKAAIQRVGMRHLQLDEVQKTVCFDRPGVEINLGSIGKGYALDRAAGRLSDACVGDFLIHGGNSSILANGSCARTAQSNGELATGGWWVGLRHPLLPKHRILEVRLRNCAVGTSGGGTQFFVHEGRRYSHILDPRTGWPAEGTLSVSVLAKTGAEADALSTAFFVAGKEMAIEYWRTHPEVAAIIATPIAGSSRCEILLIGIDENGLRIAHDDSITIRRLSN